MCSGRLVVSGLAVWRRIGTMYRLDHVYDKIGKLAKEKEEHDNHEHTSDLGSSELVGSDQTSLLDSHRALFVKLEAAIV